MTNNKTLTFLLKFGLDRKGYCKCALVCNVPQPNSTSWACQYLSMMTLPLSISR